MRAISLAVLAAATLATGACTDGYGTRTSGYVGYSRYDWNHPDPSYNGYYADRYYRHGGNYRAYRMHRDDRVYRGQDGRYYCRRSDGTTGLVVGAVAGGVLGNLIAPGDSKTFGTLLGAGLGAAAGASIDRGDVRCE